MLQVHHNQITGYFCSMLFDPNLHFNDIFLYCCHLNTNVKI